MSFFSDLKDNSIEVWEACYNHPFVQEIGQGTLMGEKFSFFLIQDYKFLLEYIKILSLSASYVSDENVLYQLLDFQRRTIEGRKNHKKFLEDLGLADADAITGLYNESYTSSLRNIAETKGLVELLVAILPCPWSYHEFACRLQTQFGNDMQNNLYRNWIENYAKKDTYKILLGMIEPYIEKMSLEKKNELQSIFKRSLEYEYLFWDMCYKQELSY